MTSQAWSLAADHAILWKSPADWVSLGQVTSFDNPGDPYVSNPPAAPGGKVSILDTDHLGWKVYVNDATLSRAWVWKSFLRGHNPILMEDLKNNSGWIAALRQAQGGHERRRMAARAAMGHTRTYANKMNLAAMTPQNGLSTTAYCLAKVGSEYLAYQAGSGAFSVNLTAGTYSSEWFNPTTGFVASTGSVKAAPRQAQGGHERRRMAAGGNQSFTPPFSGPAVLYLKVARAGPGAGSSTTSAPRLGTQNDSRGFAISDFRFAISIGHLQSAIGNRQSAIGNRPSAIGNPKVRALPIAHCPLPISDWERGRTGVSSFPSIGNRRLAIGNPEGRACVVAPGH